MENSMDKIGVFHSRKTNFQHDLSSDVQNLTIEVGLFCKSKKGLDVVFEVCEFTDKDLAQAYYNELSERHLQ